MDEFIQLLESINNLNIPDNPTCSLHLMPDIKYKIKKIIVYATVHLIDDEGRNVWENHEVLTNHGFSVYPGEVDRFGWLTGCI